MLTGLIAFTFGCTAQHDDKQAAKDPAAIHDSHDEKTSTSTNIHSSHGDSGSHGKMKMSAVTRRVLKVQTEPQEPKAGSPAKLTLQIHGNDDTPIRQFDVMHEKLVHLIVVRDGLATGELVIAGDDAAAVALVPDTSDDVTVGEMKAHVAMMPGEEATTVRFHLVDLAGKAVTDLEPWLGAMGHLVIIGADGRDYVHAHPLSEAPTGPGGTVEFAVLFPTPGISRMWGQFQHNGTVFTVPFVLEHKGGNRH